MPATWIAFARRDVQAADVLLPAYPVKRKRNAPWTTPEAS
jgi:hypothetical protein